jgi:hypothetical protein
LPLPAFRIDDHVIAPAANASLVSPASPHRVARLRWRAMSTRKSGRQRREQIKALRLERAKRLRERLAQPDARALPEAGMLEADREILARHNNPYAALPSHYFDREFVCRDCGEQQIWTAKQQKWWYEVAHGHIDSAAVRCLPCRRKRRSAHRAPGADALRLQCERIRALGNGPADEDAWREVETALASKWWGVRTVAIGVLGRWGDRRAVMRLQAIADDGAATARWNTWAYEGSRAAFKALAECLPAAHNDWAIERVLSCVEAWPLSSRLVGLPPSVWETLIQQECGRDDPARLQRLIWLLRAIPAGPGQTAQWRSRFGDHPHRLVRQAAQYAWR